MKNTYFNRETKLLFLLVAVKFLGAPVFINCVSKLYLKEMRYDDVLSVFKAYSLYVPFESLVCATCIICCIRQIRIFISKKQKNIFKDVFCILTPLVLSAVFSLYWFLVIHPTFVRVEFNYLYNMTVSFRDIAESHLGLRILANEKSEVFEDSIDDSGSVLKEENKD